MIVHNSKKKLVVDIGCKVPDAEIYCDATYEYFCALNFSNIGMNSNKFYIMQIIFSNVGVNNQHYALYTKYGRTGENGNPYLKWFDDPAQVIKAYCSQYKSKTGNKWGGTDQPKPNKYYDLKVSIAADESSVDSLYTDDKSAVNCGTVINPKCTLQQEVVDLIKLIGNKQIHIDTMRKFGVDTRKLPLGKISNSIINDANTILYALSEIVKAINDGEWHRSKIELELDDSYVTSMLYSLSNEFWTRIPYACGRNKPPPLINNLEQVNNCADLLDAMKNSKIANQILKRSSHLHDDHFINVYDSLKIKITVCSNDKEIEMIKNFVAFTKAPSHNYTLEVLEIFNVSKEQGSNKNGYSCLREDPSNTFLKTNCMLLVHGSRMSNFMGILSTGLRIPSSSQVNNGSILGRGIYFADVISKSFNYCNSHETNDIGFVLLCEVALGNKIDECETVNTSDLPKGYTSRMGLGQTDVTKTCILEGNVKCPQGGLAKREGLSNKSSFLYNEYVIFNADQYRFKYLVKIKCKK
jgi:poly [ADP-ribose] polymerase